MRRIVLASVALLFAVACGSKDSSSITGSNNNNNNNNNNASGPLSAVIDGQAWASPAPAAIYQNNIVSVAGLDIGLSASVAFATGVTGTGTYSLNFGNQLAGLGIIVEGSKSWSSGLQGGTGTLTLTTLTANHMVGTFSFDGVPSGGGATGTVHVTNGKFDITF